MSVDVKSLAAGSSTVYTAAEIDALLAPLGGGGVVTQPSSTGGSDVTIAADKFAYVPYSFEIEAGDTLEIALGGVLEIG